LSGNTPELHTLGRTTTLPLVYRPMASILFLPLKRSTQAAHPLRQILLLLHPSLREESSVPENPKLILLVFFLLRLPWFPSK
jgi:hypothetical protein